MAGWGLPAGRATAETAAAGAGEGYEEAGRTYGSMFVADAPVEVLFVSCSGGRGSEVGVGCWVLGVREFWGSGVRAFRGSGAGTAAAGSTERAGSGWVRRS